MGFAALCGWDHLYSMPSVPSQQTGNLLSPAFLEHVELGASARSWERNPPFPQDVVPCQEEGELDAELLFLG